MAMLVSACGGSVEDVIAKAKDAGLTPAQRCDAIEDLSFEGEAAVGPLRELAVDPDAEVAQCAHKAIAEIRDPAAVPALEGLLADGDAGVVASAAQALGWIGKSSSAQRLEPLLTSSDRRVVTAAVQALGRIGDASVLPSIEKVALARGATPAEEKAGRKVRRLAVYALRDIGDPTARATLVEVLSTDPPSSRAAGTALATIYQDDVTPLVPLLDKRSNIALAYSLVDVGQSGTEDALVTALHRYGDVELAEYYLNCGNGKLEKAAQKWADDNGYTVFTRPGSGGGQWGSGV